MTLNLYSIVTLRECYFTDFIEIWIFWWKHTTFNCTIYAPSK